jgi:hydroxymethylbilane synthase
MQGRKSKLVIGTRGSKLALWQAEWVSSLLRAHHPGLTIELNKIKTTGDKIQDVPLAKVGGKGLFVKEIEESLLRGESDIAVHSMKDVPSDLPKGLQLTAILKREDPRDAFVSRLVQGVPLFKGLNDLSEGARVGTSSLRRACQLMHQRPDLTIEGLRGNLDTRLRRLDEGQYEAIILAAAGLRRLGWADRVTAYIEPSTLLPAVGQGAVGIESRVGDNAVNDLIRPLNDEADALCVLAERAFLRRLEGGCQVPIAAHATIVGGILTLEGLVGSLSGDRIIRDSLQGDLQSVETIGVSLAERLLKKGAEEILKEVYGR